MKNKILASFVGGAIGDALGYPIEFNAISSIKRHYGVVRSFSQLYETDEKAVFSDDTQMTIFTLAGLLEARNKGMDFEKAVTEAYIDWLFTQRLSCRFASERQPFTDLCDIDELNVLRAPGNTCLSALETIAAGRKPFNDSKGCGGIMRIAPVAWLAAKEGNWKIEDIDRLGAALAAITHKHPLGYIPAALCVHIIYRFLQSNGNLGKDAIVSIINEGLDVITTLFPSETENINYLDGLMQKAIKLFEMPDADIEELGGGWTGEEALAIAVFCVLRHPGSFEEAIVESVNHSGDSDSTGAVCGNMMGALLGIDGIPDHYLSNIELLNLMKSLCDKL